MKMVESYQKRVENTVEKEKLLIMSNFSVSHGVFKRLVLQTSKNQGLSGKGLPPYQVTKFWTGLN